MAGDPDRMASREYLVDSNFDPNYWTGEDEEAESEEMVANIYDVENEGMPIIQFDKDNPIIDSCFFRAWRSADMQFQFAIKVGFEYIIEKSDKKD